MTANVSSRLDMTSLTHLCPRKGFFTETADFEL